MFKRIDHCVITTSDIDACLSFYQKLGFISQCEGDRYELYQDGFKINIHVLGKELLPHAKNVQVGCVDICIELTIDIHTFKRYLEKNKIHIEEGIVFRNGFYGPMQSIYIRDIDGNLLEFSQYANEG